MPTLDPNVPTSATALNLLSDGRVMVQIAHGSAWYALTPDSTGSYINGSWGQLAFSNVARQAFPTEVLTNGDVLTLGGEYTLSGPGYTTYVHENNTGEYYNPAANTWTAIPNFPESTLGDAPTEMLPDGEVLVGSNSTGLTYIYNPGPNAVGSRAPNTWTPTGQKLDGDTSAEESWVKLPDGSILTYDLEGGTAQSASATSPH